MWKGIMVGTLALFMAACTTVTTDVDKQADFSSYKTFDFGEQGGAPASIDARRIEQSIGSQLEANGLARVSSDGDIYVHHDIVENTEFVSSGSNISFGYGWNRFGVVTSSPERYRERKYGNLIIELVDKKANQVVWKGLSSRKLTASMDSEKRERLIAEEITEMFENFPYGAK
ncbi:DUF4136 domain-containing protein [Vibrio sp. EA2]|uniref:DUF4136 domain-containing protein n=1 Tax=Vibrio sp. EA2 TaxID=3079860 RepID=UPI00294981D0|nr:DUF4136 domain-containing protein [Vibrio sp. EA2]MDV6249991.1 DUF4136 domain-containing protein [Vibrio sp. EA2]